MPHSGAKTFQQMWIPTLIINPASSGGGAGWLTLVLTAPGKGGAGWARTGPFDRKAPTTTILTPLPDTTNQLAGDTLASGKGIVGATAAMGAHAAQCPGCPDCVLGGEARR